MQSTWALICDLCSMYKLPSLATVLLYKSQFRLAVTPLGPVEGRNGMSISGYTHATATFVVVDRTCFEMCFVSAFLSVFVTALLIFSIMYKPFCLCLFAHHGFLKRNFSSSNLLP